MREGKHEGQHEGITDPFYDSCFLYLEPETAAASPGIEIMNIASQLSSLD